MLLPLSTEIYTVKSDNEKKISVKSDNEKKITTSSLNYLYGVTCALTRSSCTKGQAPPLFTLQSSKFNVQILKS